MPHLLEFTLFGTPEVRLHGQSVTGFRSSKAQALLYYLAVTGRPHTRATLTGLFWGDQPEAAARTSLSKCLSNLRDLVGDAVLVDRQTVTFNPDYPHQLDTEQFTSGINRPPKPETIHALQTALTLYRGDFLEGFYVRDAPDFEQWLLMQRAQYREAVVNGLYALANYADQQGDLPQAIAHTRRLLTLEPWREEAHRHLMTRLARSGQRAAALAQFETCRRILDEELAVEPDAATVALLEQIKSNELPVKAQRVSAGHFVNRQSEIVNPLPIPPTPLVGREREVAELGELIDNPQCRLITIAGVGGMGKTRLALAAAQSAKFQHGAVFVPLAGVSSTQFLPQAILSAVNLPLQETLSLQQQVRLTLYNRECLLVLDNYEHLLPDVELLLDILYYAPQVTLLVTSRERLALQAEHLCELTGLTYPTSQATTKPTISAPTLQSYSAIELLLQRVRQIQPRFAASEAEMAAAVRICRVSEGMPLALELAAAMVREQSLVALATALEEGQARLSSRLRDLPERHRTMEAVFAHSWRLLSEDEQQVLAALSVFRGGFAVDFVQAVANATPAILVVLTDKSWLRRNPNGRYDVHELMRQYASQQLVESGEFGVVQRRYTTYFFKWSEEAQTGMSGRQPTEWMIRIEQDIDNLRATLKWLALHALEDGLLMTCNLHWLWQSRGYLREGCDWFALMLAQDASVASIVRADAYDSAGLLAIMANQIDKAEELLSQSLALHQQLDPTDPQVGEGLASVLNHLGVVALYRGDYQQAVQLCHQGLAIAQQCGSRPKTSSAFLFAGEALYLQGSFEEARRSFEECCRTNDARGGLRSRAYSYVRLGHVVCAQGDLRRASTLFAQALRLVDECRDLTGITMVLIGLARIAALCGEYERAAILTAAKEEILTVSPIMRYWPMDRAENERTLAILHVKMDDATFTTAWTKGVAMSLAQAVAYALSESSNV